MRLTVGVHLVLFFINLSSIVCHDSNTTPLSYDVILQADLDKLFFNGSVKIGIYASNDKNNEIRLSTRGINILNVDLLIYDKAPLIINYKVNERHERLDIKMNFLPSGNHSILIKFDGAIKHNSAGFFKRNCHNQTDKSSWIAGTLLEPIFARSIFPVFDLNEDKTYVKLTIILKNNLNILFSKEANIKQLGNGFQEVFVDYGVTLINDIGWIIYPSNSTISNYNIDNQTVIGCKHNWQVAAPLNLISKEMSDYTGYILNGLNWIMLPDLNMKISSTRKMVFLREHLLEDSEYKSSVDVNEDLLTVVEAYAQQLFGHIISSASWSDLWITKGLSKFLSYKIAGKLRNNFNSESYIVSNIIPRVLDRENIPHSMAKHVDSTRDLLSIYDEDLFDKAGLVMRMLEDVMGEDNFRMGVQNFVTQTTGKDYNGTNLSWYFWNTLFQNSDKFPSSKVDSTEVLMSWIRSDGYPIIYAKRSSNAIHISQIKNTSSKRIRGYWWVPISVTSQSMRQPRNFWLRPNGNITVNIPRQDEWYMINENGKGLYRINYDMENWRNLSNAIKNKELNGVAKSRIIDDAFGLAEQNLLGYKVALELTRHLSSEYMDREPWTASIKHLLNIKHMLNDSKQLLNSWNEYLMKLIKSYIYGVDNLTSSNVNSTKYLDQNDLNDLIFYKFFLISPLCRNNNYCSDFLRHIPFSIDNNTTMKNYSLGDILNSMLCYNIETNTTLWNDYMELYNMHKSPTLDKIISSAFGCTNNVSLLYSYINYMLATPEKVSKQDVPQFVSEMVVNDEMFNQLILKYKNNYMSLLEFISEDSSLFTGIIIPISERSYNKEYIIGMHDLLDIMERSDLITSSFNEPQYHRAIERIRINAWRKDMSYSDIPDWLENKENPNIDFILSNASKFSNILVFIVTFILQFILF